MAHSSSSNMSHALKNLVEERGVLARIDGSRQYWAPAFLRLGDLVTRQPELCLGMSSRRLASAAGISEATVVRFCQALGFDGLPQFKAALAVDLLMPYSTYERIEPADDTATLVRKFYEVTVHSLQKTLSLIDLEDLGKVVTAINGARRVECYGVGGLSGPLASILAYRLMNLQIPATAATEAYLLQSSARLLIPGDVAIAISFSGIAVPVLEALDTAQKRGAVTIALTNYLNAPITEKADHCLFTAALREAPLFGEALSSRLSQLAVMEILYACLAIERLNTRKEHTE